LAGRLASRHPRCAPLAGKSTLNRLEHAPAEAGPTRYHKITHDGAAIERLYVELFLDAHARPPKRLVLDLDATDDPLHGHQEGRFFHGYYDCYCYLPLYVFCGRHLLAAKLRRSNIDASAGAVEEVGRIVGQIRARWPRVRILLRADSGFAREALMAWCEANRVDYVFGLAGNDRLVERIAAELARAEDESAATGRPARRFADFPWSTRESWSRRRRVVAKAEWSQGGPNPRFVVTSLRAGEADARALYEAVYCARGEAENRIKECPLDLFADRTSAATMRANQLRLWFAAMAYVLLCALRRLGLAHNRVRGRHLRHAPPQAAEDRRPGPGERAADQGRHGLRLPLRRRVRPRSRPTTADHRRLTARPSAPILTNAGRQHRPRAPPTGGRTCSAPAPAVQRRPALPPSAPVPRTAVRNPG
jgi:hypothetical protein